MELELFLLGNIFLKPYELVTEALKSSLKSWRNWRHRISFQYLFSLYGVKVVYRKESKCISDRVFSSWGFIPLYSYLTIQNLMPI